MRIEDDNIVQQLELAADALSDIDTSRIPNLFEYISEQEFDKILEVSELLYELAHDLDSNGEINTDYIDPYSRYDYYVDDQGGLVTEKYEVKEEIEYKGYYISYIPDYIDGYTVQYCGDDIIFDTIDEAKTFIDGIWEEAKEEKDIPK